MSGTTSHHYEKRWAIVIGASSGIGRAFTRELASRGYSVLAVARRRDRLDAVAKEAADRGATVEPIVADLETEAGVASVVRRVEAIGPVELLVNNAGTSAAGDFLDTPFAEQTGAIRLNVEALVSLTRQILKGMVQRKCGAVINLASVLAFQPFPHFAVYAATKAFVLTFTEAIAEELKGTGVRILALCPGAVRTEMDVFSGNEGLLGKLPSLSAEQVVKSGLHALLMGASARPPRPVSSSEVSL
jgi:short-subunit dehydrogenase